MDELNYEPEHSLTVAERDQLMQDLDRDGYIVLPFKLPAWMIEEVNREIDRIVDEQRKFDPHKTAFNGMNIVERAPIFRRLMMYKPALQLGYDCFGPQFVLSQDQFWVQFCNPELPSAVGWHSDGPANFPQIDGRCALHSLRFGYALSDNTAEDCGAIDVIRGSHKKRVLHARRNLHWEMECGNDEADFSQDLVQVRGEVGTIYAFHNALWHRALPNMTDQARKIAYFQYTPSWMRPHHRSDPSLRDLQFYTPEERWLLGEPRDLATWIHQTDHERNRLARFSREAP